MSTQTSGKHLECGNRDGRVLQTNRPHVTFSDKEKHRVFIRDGRCRVGSVIENWHVSKNGSSTLGVYDLFSSVRASPQGAYRPANDNVESAGLFAGNKQNLFPRELVLSAKRG